MTPIRSALPLTALAVLTWQLHADDAAQPPVAKKLPHVTVVHGDTLTDNYHWLREKTSPEVLAHLKAENNYTAAMTKSAEPFIEALYREILGHIKQTDLGVPYKLGGYLYYSRTEEGKQYAVACRKRVGPDAKEEILLDGNELAKGHKFFSLGTQVVSDDGNVIAYATDVTGFREYTVSFKDLRTGTTLPDRIVKSTGGVWVADNRTFFYVTEDAAKRAYRLYRHVLGGDKDELVYEEKDDLFRLSVARSLDRKYVFATSHSSTTSECRYLPADQPTGAFRVVLPRETGHEYAVAHRDGQFYIRTNKDAKNFKLVAAPVGDPSVAGWKELIPHRPDVLLETPAVFANHLLVTERENGLPQLRVTDLRSGESHRVAMPEPVFTAFALNNREYDTATIQFQYTSLVTPMTVYEYDMNTKDRKVLKRTEVIGFDPSQYRTERIYVTAADGRRVPVSLVCRKDVKCDGTAPLLLTGYGAYGSTTMPVFSVNNLTYLDRGVVVAQAQIRGGSDLGKEWHEQGRMMQKKNTFTDFIACADHLVAEKYAARDRLVIEGGSAGGLLIGAVVNMRPDLCKAAVLQVPFVDVVNTMLDASLPLTVQEYLEWGNPNVKAEYDYIKTYCPYTNVAAKAYPAMLVTTSLNDSQVMYWEPAKYVAKLRELKTDKNPLLFRVNMAGGHGGSSGRYDALREAAFKQAFVLGQMGVTK
jgi:oligopeptidase B